MSMMMRIKDIHKKMQDPIVAQWAIDRLSDKRGWAPDIEEFERMVFDDETIQRLVCIDDHAILSGVLLYVSLERLRIAAPLIAEQWPHWTGTLAGTSMIALAEIAPERAESLLNKCIESVYARHDTDKLLGVFQALLKSKDARWKAPASRVIDAVRARKNPLVHDLLLPTMIAVASVHALPVFSDLLAELMTGPFETESIDGTLQPVYRVTFDRLPFFEMLTESGSGSTHQSFGSLSRFFCDEAPLDQLDRAIRLASREKIRAASELLSAVPEPRRRPLQSALVSVYKNKEREIRQGNQDIIAQFMLAVTAACYVREAFDWSQLSLSELFDVASWDIRSFPGNGYDEIIANIKRFPKGAIVSHMNNCLPKTSNTYGEAHLVRIMGALGWNDFVPTLVNLLCNDKADFVCEEADKSLCKMGPAAETEIIARWKELDDSQRIYGMRILGKVGGERTVRFLVNAYPEMRNADLDPWCDMAMCVPDIRLVEVLEPDVRRKHPVIDEAFTVLCALLDVFHPSLISARARVEENREYVRQRTEAGPFDDVFEENIRIELRCPLCGDLNIYDVKEVYVDPKRQGAAPFISEEITCSSCGKQPEAEFELTEKSFAVLSAEAMRITGAIMKDKEVESPIKFVESRLVDGRPMFFREIIEYHRRALEEDPGSVVDLIALGNTYLNVRRTRKAEECYRRCFDLDKTCPEAAVSLAKIHMERGEMDCAFDIMNESLRRKDAWRYYRLDRITPKEFVKHFVEVYNRIRDRLHIENLPQQQISFFSKETRRDVGRNDPCPCGSGKKYKKCCLGKGR